MSEREFLEGLRYEDKFPEGEAYGDVCGDPCPEAPDLLPCQMVPGHFGPWHRNRSSAWPTASNQDRDPASEPEEGA